MKKKKLKTCSDTLTEVQFDNCGVIQETTYTAFLAKGKWCSVIRQSPSMLQFITEIQQALTDKSKGGTKDGTYSKDEVIDLIDKFCFTEMRSCIEVKRYKGFIEKYLNKKASNLSVLEFSMLNQANEILNKVK